MRRWAFAPTLKGLKAGLAPVTVLRGPRQVGKTTTLNQIIDTQLELRLKRRKGASKLILRTTPCVLPGCRRRCPWTRRACWPRRTWPTLAGRIAESTAGQLFKAIINLGVNHFPERGSEPEVDYILTVGDQRIPVQIKYRRRIEHADTRGLRAFVEKSVYNAPFGVLVTLLDEPGSDDPRIVSMPLSTLMLMR